MSGPEHDLPAAHLAIRASKQGRLHPRQMLQQLVAGKMVVPTSGMPELANGQITGWHPAMLAKTDGSRWLVAFTTQAGADAYIAQEPAYGFYFNFDTRWVLRALAPECGIVFNIGSEEQLEWNAQGLAKYKKECSAGSSPAMRQRWCRRARRGKMALPDDTGAT